MATAAKRVSPATASMLDTGLEPKDRNSVSKDLVEVLADTYTLLLKTHVYHWNVVGPLFVPLHELTEAHYKDLFQAADDIAERIRSLGHPAPLSFRQLLPKSAVDEETSDRSAEQMVAHLVVDHEKIVKRLRDAAMAADEADDLVTTDLLTARLAFHEKAIWMLRAIIGSV
ncbi:MAG: Dps family protein [Hyphomicrobiaceae bacterium]|nr:Dps family protein [Hyphomicrobiaceae bacterium]